MPNLRCVLGSRRLRPLVASARSVWEGANDVLLNIDTSCRRAAASAEKAVPSEQEASGGPRYSDSVAYESPDYWYIRQIRRMLFGRGDREETFVDVGSGKGRILCAMARRPLRKVIGVELAADLCRRARRNAEQMRGRKAPIEILCQDAASADLSEGTVYFLFNPFGRDTLRAVCENIRRSLLQRPRRIRVVYYNAVCRDIFESSDWLSQYHEFETQNGLPVTFWSNT